MTLVVDKCVLEKLQSVCISLYLSQEKASSICQCFCHQRPESAHEGPRRQKVKPQFRGSHFLFFSCRTVASYKTSTIKADGVRATIKTCSHVCIFRSLSECSQLYFHGPFICLNNQSGVPTNKRRALRIQQLREL